MELTKLSLLLTLFNGAVHAVPAQDSATNSEIGIPGAFEVPVEWAVQAFPDGPELTLKGTVQEVHAQLVGMNPNYDADFGLAELDARDDKLVARSDFRNTRTDCGPQVYGKASVDRLNSGIKYLRKLKGQPRNGGGPGACGRVSCSYNTAIWWCNDDRKAKTLNSWGSVADGAQRVWDVCAGRLDYDFYPGQVGGQAFHPTNWNVIVRHNKC